MQTESSTPPGTLTGVMYSDFGGMTVRNDFFIWLSPDAIVETFYYPEEPPKGVGWHDRFDKENVPITAEQWADVEQVVLELYPLMAGAKDRPVEQPGTLVGRREGRSQFLQHHPHLGHGRG